MNKKIFLACLVLIAAVASIGMVAAVSEVNLPDGYSLDDSLNVTNETTQLFGVDCIYNRLVMVNGDKNITVDTFFPEKEITLTPANGSEMKNIAGVDGLYQEKDGRFIFIYSDNNQFVQIDSPEESLIQDVIGK